MKLILFLTALICFSVNLVFAQIDGSIPTPADLKGKDVKIVSKQKLAEGIIEIVYIKSGKQFKRKIYPTNPGQPQRVEEREDKPGQAPAGAAPVPQTTPGNQPIAAAGEPPGAKKEAQAKPSGGQKPTTGSHKPVTGPDITRAVGTGNTTGHIADLTVKNPNDFPIAISPQTFYIPSGGTYQSYVGRIGDDPSVSPEGEYPGATIIPPKGTVDIPVYGYCADVNTPPVPSGNDMPPITSWIPVGKPFVPPVTTTDESKPPVNTNPSVPGETPVIAEWTPVSTINPVPEFNPSDIPSITNTPGYNPGPSTDPEIIITWPGTDIPVGGTLLPTPDPLVFAPLIVTTLIAIETATDDVQGSGMFSTPFSGNPEKEREAIIQQTFWIYNAAIAGKKYSREDFTDNAYKQFQDISGQPVTSLSEEQKEDLDNGLTDFWNTFQVTGVAAKVLHSDSPGISQDDARLGEQIGYVDSDADKVADTKEEEEEDFKCECPDTISYSLSVKTGKDTFKQLEFKGGKTVLEEEVKVENLKFGDTLSVQALNVVADCTCAGTRCDMTWELYFHETRSNNCEEHKKDSKNNLIWVKTKAANKKNKAILVYGYINITCKASGCSAVTCYRDFKLTIKDTKSK